MQRFLAISAMLAALAAVAAGGSAAAQEDSGWVQATSLIESPRYPPGFDHFNYVNPDAPKGGVARMSGSSPTYDTLNPILPKGVPADGLGLVYESLMMRALDEYDISGQYPQIADALRYPPDFSYVTYRINPKAKWHDGEPITPEDVVWSFNKTVEVNPSQRFYYQHVTKAEVTAPDQVTFTFDQTGNHELPQIVGELLILPKHWWEAKDANGNPRDVGESSLEPPLGSGPYKVKDMVAGRSITYERVPDFWGADLNTYKGQNNFDEVRFEYYRDLNVEFEAFKADDFDYWAENEAKRWATGYDFPAIKDDKVVKELVNLEQTSGVMVGFVPNLRRPLFQDVRVRRALNLAFDFEQLNKDIFFGQYERINSFYYGIPIGWHGLPMGRELEILNSVKGEVPPEVFTEEYKNPVGGDPQKVRDNLRQAVQLFQEAGYHLQGNQMIDPNGKPVSFEILLNGPTIERVAIPYQQSLKRIGIDVNVRSVDSSQFVTRLRSRDFDMIYAAWGQSNSPGNEQLDFWGSEAADRDSSRNYAGIKDPGGRHDHQRHHLRQGPVRAACGGGRARPRADVEPVRDPELHDPGRPHRALGSLRAPALQGYPVHHRLSDGVVVGRRQGGEDRRLAMYDLRRGFTRREAMSLAGAALAAPFLPHMAFGAGETGLHGLSIFGELKYGAGFKNFEYAKVTAPKGGRMNFQPGYRYYNQNSSTFNTLNSFILKGDAPPRMEFLFDTLLASAADEPDAMYGLVAETVDVSEDGNVYTFHLRSSPRFHDGTTLTAEDVGVLVDAAQGEGPSQHRLGPDADGEGRSDGCGDGRCHAGRVAEPRDDPQHRRDADLLQGVLREPPVRFLDA